MEKANEYWTHNVAYHGMIIKNTPIQGKVLDIGCGDGLLAYRLAKKFKSVTVTGIDTDKQCVKKAKMRVCGLNNADIINTSFEEYDGKDSSFDMIVFVASIHHMDMEKSITKAKRLLADKGKLIIIGCSKPHGIIDFAVEILRVIPAKMLSAIHGETSSEKLEIPTMPPDTTLIDVKEISKKLLPNAKITRGLYYRYKLIWIKNKAHGN